MIETGQPFRTTTVHFIARSKNSKHPSPTQLLQQGPVAVRTALEEPFQMRKSSTETTLEANG